MSKTSGAKRRTAIACLTTLSLAALVFAPSALAASAPTAVTGPNTPFPEGKVRLLGYVDPEGSPVTACKFVYGPEAGNYTSEAPCANHPGNEIQALIVGATSGQFRLLFEGQETTDLPFDATAAEVQSALESLPAIGAGGVVVERIVNTLRYRRYQVSFQGSLADTGVPEMKGENGTEPLVAEGVSIIGTPETPHLIAETLVDGGLAESDEVTANLEGLTPGATYHYRLIAENAEGRTESEDALFNAAEEEQDGPCPNEASREKLHTAFLPECRAWEIVSPPAKNGGDILDVSESARIADDGSAASFASPSAFADTSGAGVNSMYEAIRTPSGWQSHGIFPRLPAGLTGLDGTLGAPTYEGAFSPDLNMGILFTIGALDGSEPFTEEVTNLYLRTDLRSPGKGTYRLVTGCPLCVEKSTALQGVDPEVKPFLMGASPGFKHIVFESRFNLVKPANSSSLKLYEDEEGTLRLVGILPGGQAASTSVAAIGRPFNVAVNPGNVSADGSKVFWTDGTDIYMRLDHETTVQLNKSELSPSEGNGSAVIRYVTPDGSKVFFTDGTRLAPSAHSGGGTYVYDTTKSPSDPDNLTFVGSGQAIGAAADGETAYLVEGGHLIKPLYSLRANKLQLIGKVTQGSDTYSVANKISNLRVSRDGQILFLDEIPPHGLAGQFPGYCPETANKFCDQVYTYDPATEALQCTSCPSEGTQGANAIITHRYGITAMEVLGGESHAISSNGDHVFFSTAAALVPEDLNGVIDTYSYNTRTSRVSLLSGGTDPYPSYFMDATPDGSNALFTTKGRLSGWDFDTNADLYDARVDGGLPEPPPLAEPCHGEACPLVPASTPARAANGSGHLEGPGNPKPKHHRKHHRKRHRHRGHRGHK